MPYSEFSIADIKKKFGIKTSFDFDDFINSVPCQKIGERLLDILTENVSLALAINTEKARSEFIVAPILSELRRIMQHKISIFSGIDFPVDASKGLNGKCDFLISLDSEQLILTAPIITVVEAKNDDINSGLGQCIAEMIASKIFNDKEQNGISIVYGIITTGSLWKFLKLEENSIHLQSSEIHIDKIDKIFGILQQIVTK